MILPDMDFLHDSMNDELRRQFILNEKQRHNFNICLVKERKKMVNDDIGTIKKKKILYTHIQTDRRNEK